MSEELNQKISRLLDHDLSSDEAQKLLEKVGTTPELQARMNRYALISQVLKQETLIQPSLEFTKQVRQRLESEPIRLAPRPNVRRLSPGLFRWPALAAGLAALAIVVNQRTGMEPKPEVTVVAQLMPEQTKITKPANVMTARSEAESLASTSPADADESLARFREYLQAHNSSRYRDGSIRVHPYAQVASAERK